MTTTQPIRRYTLNVYVTEPRDPDDGEASPKERRYLERKIIKLLAPLDGDVDAEVMTVEDLTESCDPEPVHD
jgi:hypothetical protein